MTHPVIEAMARAMHDAEWQLWWPSGMFHPSKEQSWLDLRHDYLNHIAPAALIAAAKVTPSEGMTQVGKDADLKAFLEEPSSIAAVGIYQAMFAQLVWEIEG